MADSAVSRGKTPFKSYVTPFTTDVLFYELVTGTLPKNSQPSYGAPHHNPALFPDHELVFISPGKGAGEQLWWYAAKREKQDEYNFEHTTGGPDFKFDTIKRLYVIKRKDYKETEPAYASSMPKIPEGKWSDGYILFQKLQVRSEVQELDSLYVFEQRIYVKRISITKVVLDIQTGRSKDSITIIYARGEEVSPGVTIEQVVADRNSPYRGLQPDGTFREIEQLSENFFAVAISTLVPEGTVTPPGGGGGGGVINPPTAEVVERPTPKVDDYIVHFKAGKLDGIQYGAAHPVRTGFFLVYIKPADETGHLYEYFYAKSFNLQDDYNFDLNNSDILTRAYIVPRAAYLAGTALPSLIVGEKTPYPKDSDIPVGQQRPALFDKHGYTHEYVSRADKELDSHFIVIIRVFQKIRKVRRVFDPDLNHYIEHVQLILRKDAAESAPDTIPQPAPGRVIDRNEEHTQFDVYTVKTVIPNAGEANGAGFLDFPIQLPTVLGDSNYDFPPHLDSINLDTIWAYAASTGAPPAFDQDFAFTFKMKEPSPGPYMTQTIRLMTDNPEALKSQYPLAQKAVPQRETIIVGSGFWHAHPDGNQAKAELRTIEVPPCIHPEIPITEPDGPAIGLWTEKLDATPNYSNYAAQGVLNVGIRSFQTEYGFYILEITQLNAGGAYSGQSYPWGEGSIGGSGGGTVILVPPVVSEVSASDDNKTAIGFATPSSVIRLYSGSGNSLLEEGRGTSDGTGKFEVAINVQYRDPKQLYATARKGGLLSQPLGFMTKDLLPLAPTAYIDPGDDIIPGLIVLGGQGQPGALLHIALAPVKQSMTMTVTGTATADTVVKFTIAAAVLGVASPIEVVVNILNTDDASIVAMKVRNEVLRVSDAIKANFTINSSGNQVIAEWKLEAMNDGSASMRLDGADGVGTSTSTPLATGRGTATITIPPDGEFTYLFSPALEDQDVVILTVEDAAGTSPELELIADALSPPIPTGVRFPTVALDGTVEYDRIKGTGVSGRIVVALLKGVVKGTATVAGDNSFSIDLDMPYVSGESFQVYSHINLAPSKRSDSVPVVAHNLDLPELEFTETEGLFLGTLPEYALALVDDISDIKVVVRREADAPSEHVIDIFPNREWQFSIRDVFGLSEDPKNGQRYEIFYRFPQADAKMAVKAYPIFPLPSPSFAWVAEGTFTVIPQGGGVNANEPATVFPAFLVERAYPSPANPGLIIREKQASIGYRIRTTPGVSAYVNPDDHILVGVRVPWLGDPTTVAMRFPGSSKAPIDLVLTTPPTKEDWKWLPNWLGPPNPPLPTPVPCAINQYTILPVVLDTDTPTEPGSGVHALIPPVMVCRVTAPDGRIIENTINRASKPPFNQ